MIDQNNDRYQSQQVVFISSRKRAAKIVYQVQKDGVIFLRKLKNKKFRVIFNIIPINDHNLKPDHIRLFNQNLINGQASNLHKQPQQQIQQITPHSNCITISSSFKQISQNRVIVIFNAYIDLNQPPQLLIFGYLISSLVIYHNGNNEFSQQSSLTNMLCQFGKILRNTNIDELNQMIKFKTGYNKFPYFLCLMNKSHSSVNNHQNYLNDFYRFQSQKQNSKINLALQTIIDFFPQRSSHGIAFPYLNNLNPQSFKQIQQIGHQYQQKIIGRQIFNFQFTGTTIENLAFEICECLGTQEEINLIDVYNRVIVNKKLRVEDQGLNEYYRMVKKALFFGKDVDVEEILMAYHQSFNQLRTIMPVSQSELNSILVKIRNQVLQEASLQALNCMNLQQYLKIQSNLLSKITAHENKLHQLNNSFGSIFANQCYQILDVDNFLSDQTPENFSSQTLGQSFQLLSSKVQAFSNECLKLFTEMDHNATAYNQKFMSLIKGLIEKLKHKVCQAFSRVQIQKKKDKLRIQDLMLQLKITQSKSKSLQQQYDLQLMIEHQLKSKLKSYMTTDLMNQTRLESNTQNYKQIYRMKKQIQQLQEQINDKNNNIEELMGILEKFESPSKMIEIKGDKFNVETVQLINQANAKINQFYTILQETKNVQKLYQKAKKSLLKQKQHIIAQRKQSLKQLTQIKSHNQKLKAQNLKLQQIIKQQKTTLQKFNTLITTMKTSIQHLQTSNAQLNCALAQTQSEFQTYRKALLHTVQYVTKGKSENLLKFYKFLSHQELKELLRPIIGKK